MVRKSKFRFTVFKLKLSNKPRSRNIVKLKYLDNENVQEQRENSKEYLFGES